MDSVKKTKIKLASGYLITGISSAVAFAESRGYIHSNFRGMLPGPLDFFNSAPSALMGYSIASGRYEFKISKLIKRLKSENNSDDINREKLLEIFHKGTVAGLLLASTYIVGGEAASQFVKSDTYAEAVKLSEAEVKDRKSIGDFDIYDVAYGLGAAFVASRLSKQISEQEIEKILGDMKVEKYKNGFKLFSSRRASSENLFGEQATREDLGIDNQGKLLEL